MSAKQFIIVQAIGLLGSVLSILSLQNDNRKQILATQIFCCILWTVHYGLLGAYTAVLTNIIGLGRGIVFYNNTKSWAKNKFWMYLFILLFALSAVVTWNGFYCILPCISMTLTTIALWSHNMKKTRFLFLLNSPPLLAYNLITKSYSCALIEAVAFVSFIIAIWRFDIRKKQNAE